MKAMKDVFRTMPLVAAIAIGLVAIFYLSDDGMTKDSPIVTDASAETLD